MAKGPVERAREKVISALAEQKAMVEAKLAGQHYAPRALPRDIYPSEPAPQGICECQANTSLGKPIAACDTIGYYER